MMAMMIDNANLGWQSIPRRSSVSRDANAMRILPEYFVPGKWDVICHCGRESQEHIGNRRFNLCIKNHLKSYSKSTSRPARSAIITNIVSSIRDAAAAGFVRMDAATGRWYEVGDKMARDKVGQALRDALNSETRGKKTQVERKRKRPSLENAKPVNPRQPSTTDPSRQMEKKHIAVLGPHPMYNTISKPIDAQLLLKPVLTAKETRIKLNSPPHSKSKPANRKEQGSGDEDVLPLDSKSMDLLNPPTTLGQSESKQSPSGGAASSKSPKSSMSSDSNQLSLIEWFERDMQDDPLW